MTARVLVVGSLNMDLVVRTPRHPEPGETILGRDFRTYPGGKGANQAVAAARLGASVAMIGRVGNDDFGQALLRALAEDHVDTQDIRRDGEAATGVALITVNESGQNTIVVASGANARVTPLDIENAEAAFSRASVLLVQLESPLPAVARAVELARKRGVRVILNPAPAQPLPPELLAQVDYLLPNQTELDLLAGLEGDHSTAAAARRIQASGARNVIVTLGEQGVRAFVDGSEYYIPSYQVPVVDTTAAGDSFAGAFAVALAENTPVLEAAAWGNAAGALAVTRSGAQPSLPTRAELESFLKSRAEPA